MPRLLLLDGMRGLAALAVVAFHMPLVSKPLFAQAWLAVDFFFLLSGFVMARAYGSRFAAIGLRQFMRLRLRRLYPAILAGLLISAALHLALWPPNNLLWLEVLLAAVFFPFPFSNIFPLNGVQWSLMFELLANAVHAKIPAEAARSVPLMLMVVGAACLLFATFTGVRINGGNTLDTLWIGFARVLFSFFAGVTIFGAYQRGALARVPSLPQWLVLALFAFVLALPTVAVEPPRDPLTIILVWPLLFVLALRAPEPTGRFATACRHLGWISYPVYATHLPIFDAMRPLIAAWGWPATALTCAVMLAVAILVGRLTEPVRQKSQSLAPAA